MIETMSDAGKSAPPKNPVAITKSDSTTYSPAARAFWVGTSGNIAFTLVGGGTVTLKSVAAGMWHGMIGIEKVMYTDTTAVDIVLGY